ncbi:ABC transporter permease [Neotabrizicola sp. VNH66]|uniref:ABC transporter permease n=1 Tax=Neotabrizicola sp. VNH66 TaxID=3400918 RepID=UPI003C0CD277
MTRGLWPALPALGLVAAMTVVPLGIMAVVSVLSPAPWGGVQAPLSAAGWQGLAFRQDVLEGTLHLSADHLLIYARSFALALATTAICLVLGFPLAWVIVTRPPAQRRLWLLAVTVPFWTSLLVRTLAMMLVLGDQGVLNTGLQRLGLIAAPLPLLYNDAAVLAGLVYAALPFMVLPVYAALARMDAALVEAAADLHASRWQILRQVLWPMARPGVLSGAVLVFVPTLGAYVVPLILGGGRAMMAGDLIALQFGAGRNWPLGAAEAMVLLALLGLAFALRRLLAGRVS